MGAGNKFQATVPSRRSALTLIEVLASLLLISTLAAGMLVAQSRALVGLRRARLEVEASQRAGELIARMRLEPAPSDIIQEGTFDPADGWSWVRRAQRMEVAPNIAVTEISLTLRCAGENETSVPWVREFRWFLPPSSN